MRVQRRGVLFGLLGVCSAYAIGKKDCSLQTAPSPLDPLMHELVCSVAVPNPVQIGSAALTLHPEWKREPQRICQEWLNDLQLTAARSTTELCEALRNKAQRQFERGETEQVDTWYLARCEVQLCALLALAASDASGC